MRVLYLTNYHNPYRDAFFEQLGKACNLTVFFEQRADTARDASWFDHPKPLRYNEVFKPKGTTDTQHVHSLVKQPWDVIVFGCYNSPVQAKEILNLRHLGVPYVINSDGMVFPSANPIKESLKRHILKGAQAYLIAGEKCAASLRKLVGDSAMVQAYPFTSLTRSQISRAASLASTSRGSRNKGLVLSVGLYKRYKGLDVLLHAARWHREKRFRIIGVGEKEKEIRRLVKKAHLHNVDVVPFLQPRDLAREFATAGLFVLPSRQECWGLVVNEAAAHGCPIVSTWGAGAAVEFLSDTHPELLAHPGDARSLAHTISRALSADDRSMADYAAFLMHKSSKYTIEGCVAAHLALFDRLTRGARA